MKQETSSLECPFCGAKPVNREEFARRTGMEIEKTFRWNGEARIVLRLGEMAIEAQKRTGQDLIDKQRLLDLFKEEQERIDERQKEIEENRKNIAKEQKEVFDEITKQRKELEARQKQLEEKETKQMTTLMAEKEKLHALKEEVLKAEQVKMPEELVKQVKELQNIAAASNMEVKDLLGKLIHNVKSSGTLQEALLLRRLKELNTGDKIEHLGGPDQEDVLATIVDSGKTLGRIRLDSKKVEKWDSSFVGKMAKYLKDNGIEFGIISTTTMPKNAAGNYFHWEENVLIVNERVVEGAYLICRYLIRKEGQYANENEKRLNLMKESEKRFEAVKKVLENSNIRKYLTAISQEVVKGNKKLEDFDKYTQKTLKGLREVNAKIVKQVDTALDSDMELQKVLSGT
ncbi:MAG: hypothetical protein A3D34_01395 [Candidatus Staskawiczbacteria bacterium RIFCSPHIGHO2_02_FULL_33_16]|uniref:DUF2130 domain-containing protein n=1 Tax=Candidatus Staskawiczbacteria bacterium RIFCSPHIGHO2_02_FULL_33_16 TaxID=1802204 RepID=A0A1G2HUZ6_9BACT|nr:MAG: hypothetical protein A3D34_01395 [Candidatus Staskawiczbacteria bacterium RIFCSPHIGHO2_02_FULL_33_16]